MPEMKDESSAFGMHRTTTNNYESIQWLLSTVSFFLLALVTVVVCSVLNCWIEQRREDAREQRRRMTPIRM
jgi:hypothetical protein